MKERSIPLSRAAQPRPPCGPAHFCTVRGTVSCEQCCTIAAAPAAPQGEEYESIEHQSIPVSVEPPEPEVVRTKDEKGQPFPTD